MPDDIRLGLRLSIEGGKDVSAELTVNRKEIEKLEDAVEKASGQTDRYDRTTKRSTQTTRRASAASRQAARTNQRLASSARQVAQANRGVGRSFFEARKAQLGYIVSAAGLALAARAAQRNADSYTELNNRLRLVTDSENELIATRQRLLRISQDTRTELGANAELYSRLALATREQGRSQAEVLRVTEVLNKQVQIGGSTASEAAGGLVQLAQGLAAGRLQGDELRSVLESLQGVTLGLLGGFRKLRQQGKIDFDVTIGNIRELAAEGKITSEVLLDAILASADETDRKFQNVNKTVSGGLVQIGNAALAAIGGFDQAAGASAGLAESLGQIAEGDFDRGLALLNEAATALAVILVARASPALLKFAQRQGAAAAAALTFNRVALTSAQRARALSIGMTQGAAAAALYARRIRLLNAPAQLLSGTMALLGGPAGVITLAAFALYEFAQAARRANAPTEEYAELLERANRAAIAGELSPGAQRSALADALNEKTGLLEEAITKRAEALAKLEALNDRASRAGAIEESRGVGGLVTVRTRVEAPAEEDIAAARSDFSARDRAAEFVLTEAADASAAFAAASRKRSDTAAPASIGDDAQKVLDSLLPDEAKIRAEYQARIDLVSKEEARLLAAGGEGALAQAAQLAQGRREFVKRRDQDLADLAAKGVRDEEAAREAAFREAGLPGLVSRIERGRELTKAGLAAQLEADKKTIRDNAAALADAGIDANALRLAAERQYAEAVRDLAEEDRLRRLELERESHEAAARAREEAHVEELAQRLGFADALLGVEYDRLGALQELQEQELLQAQGFHSRAQQQELEHREALIDIESQGADKVASIRKNLARFEALTDKTTLEGQRATGKQKLQAGIAVAQETAALFAAQSKKAFRFQQALGIAQAAVSIATGVARAFEKGSIFGYIEAAIITAAGLAQIQAIRAQQPPTGFALGGVVDRPTFFTARNVPRGVAGEAGPEAILPLRRGRAGRLGVEAGGGSRAGRMQQLTFAPVIQVEYGGRAEDADEISDGLLVRLEGLFLGFLAEQQRPGGQLNSADTV